MSFGRQASDGLRLLCFAAIAGLGSGASAAPRDSSFDSYFPRNQYPDLSDMQPPGPDTKDDGSLAGNIQILSSEISKSVKQVAQKRNLTCLGDPCLVQVFPMMYSKPNSGFFGGFRARLTNISRQDPYLYAFDAQVIRSDTAQWLAQLGADIPQIDLKIARPRWKIRSSYARSTEFRYTGQGLESSRLVDRPDNDKRYSINETSYGSSIMIPLTRNEDSKFGIYGSYDHAWTRNNPFDGLSSSLLFDERPDGYRGGTFRSMGAGFYIDTRPTETLTRSGAMMEVGARLGILSDPRLYSYRFTIIDRRYQTAGRWTLAHRLTMDGIFLEAPFWEKAGVGGIDPIRDISGSGILKAYTGGRFHENFKFIESLELRIHQNELRVIGLKGDVALMPLAADVGFMSRLFVWSLATGFDVMWNRSFLTRLYVARSPEDWALRLRFSQEF